jgi:hypothetical protein
MPLIGPAQARPVGAERETTGARGLQKQVLRVLLLYVYAGRLMQAASAAAAFGVGDWGLGIGGWGVHVPVCGLWRSPSRSGRVSRLFMGRLFEGRVMDLGGDLLWTGGGSGLDGWSWRR